MGLVALRKGLNSPSRAGAVRVLFFRDSLPLCSCDFTKLESLRTSFRRSPDPLAPIGAIPAKQRFQPANVALQNFPHRRSFLIANFARVRNIVSFDGAKSWGCQIQKAKNRLNRFTLARSKGFILDDEELLSWK